MTDRYKAVATERTNIRKLRERIVGAGGKNPYFEDKDHAVQFDADSKKLVEQIRKMRGVSDVVLLTETET